MRGMIPETGRRVTQIHRTINESSQQRFQQAVVTPITSIKKMTEIKKTGLASDEPSGIMTGLAAW
jgi:hypothetical protein